MASTRGFRTSPIPLLKAGPGFQLASVHTGSSPGFSGGKSRGHKMLAQGAKKLADLQEKLFADAKFGGNRSLLLVLQAMDTAGKGGTISHVVGAMDPQGVQLKAFKAPTEEEKSHDFLWRIRQEIPRPGMVGVFDRSHYEDVLIHRVHKWAPEKELARRYRAITEFEAELAANGTTIIKVMLHISGQEQKQRLLARLEDPHKYWKYSTTDLQERACWQQYMDAYQIAIERSSSEVAPWFVVPADRKWYARLAVQEIVVDAMNRMDLSWPSGDFDVAQERRNVAAS